MRNVPSEPERVAGAEARHIGPSIHWRRETRHSAFARSLKRLCVLIGSRLKLVFGDKKTITSLARAL